MGYGDYIGDDDVDALLAGDEIGAVTVRRPGNGMARTQAGQLAQAMRQAQQPRIMQRTPDRPRYLPIGFDSVSTIAAAASSNLTQNPQVLFKPRRLVVAGSIASSFAITDFKIGKDSQFAASSTLPADSFGPTATNVELECDTAQVNSTITLAVTNLSLAALRFLATLFGESVI